jgi:hypothetical protein
VGWPRRRRVNSLKLGGSFRPIGAYAPVGGVKMVFFVFVFSRALIGILTFLFFEIIMNFLKAYTVGIEKFLKK